jgi:hypothetical protein
MEARNSDGSWAGEEAGWTEGDHWAYSLDVMVHPIHIRATKDELIIARCPRFNSDHGWKHLLHRIHGPSFRRWS